METVSRGTPGPFSSINVTPFVDVALVLLIIFMVVTPIIVTKGVVVPGVHEPELVPEGEDQLTAWSRPAHASWAWSPTS